MMNIIYFYLFLFFVFSTWSDGLSVYHDFLFFFSSSYFEILSSFNSFFFLTALIFLSLCTLQKGNVLLPSDHKASFNSWHTFNLFNLSICLQTHWIKSPFCARSGATGRQVVETKETLKYQSILLSLWLLLYLLILI